LRFSASWLAYSPLFKKLDSDEINNIAEYELPLTRLVAEIDVDTDRYELGILRALRLDPLNPPELAAAISAKQAMTDELRADVDAATALLAKAIQDPSYRTAERVDLARIEGAFKYLVRSLEGFLATGALTMSALVDGRREDARTASLGSPSLRKHLDRTYPRFAAAFPIFRIVLPVLFLQDNGLTLT
jgi:adenylate cyclase